MVALPHAQADLDSLLQQIESLAKRRKRQTKAGRLLGIVACSDAEHGAASREHVEGRHHLGQQAGGPVRDRGGKRKQANATRVGGDEAKRRVRLDLAYLWPSQERVLPQMVGHVDAVEASRFGLLNDLGEL